ncbi:unnamed protein product [Peronospora farinosa]|uniref:Integrase catalytic domain-containing protein n=2 Tax=Peronospora farinosa TaxID=134698 RepID=A0AAV0TBP6_9STRA|nr:unnamed protein product [Peronospora farinosa]
MSLSSDSDSDTGKRKGFKIGQGLLDQIAIGKETLDDTWNAEQKGEFKKKQAKIKILIQGSLSMKLAKQVMMKGTGTEMWSELVSIYEGKTNPAMTAQKVYRLQGELHRTHMRGKGNVRSHLHKLFDIRNQLADLGSPVNDLQMVDRMLRSLPALTCYDELRRKVLFSSKMTKYTPELLREMIITAESRSEDWEGNIFGYKEQKRTQGTHGGSKQGRGPHKPLDKKPATKTRSDGCYNCGGDHFKRDCPDLDGKKNARTNYACSGGTPLEQGVKENRDDESEDAQKREVVIGEVVKLVDKDYEPCRWYFDTGSNAHITACKEYFMTLQSMEDSEWNPTISEFADGVDAKAEGFGTILLEVMVDEQLVMLMIEDVLYVPSLGCNLFSPGLSLDQGFKMTWENDARLFGMMKDGAEVIRTSYENHLWTFLTHNISSCVNIKGRIKDKKTVFANFAVTDGVADIDVWHERLGHVCPEYIRLMVDRGLAKGIMLQRRGKFDCADCHFGKQRRKTYRKTLDRNITRVNDVIFADLLIPGVSNGSPYSAVLVVMDGFSRYVKTYLLKSKTEGEVNQHIKNYIKWAERQHANGVDRIISRELTEGNADQQCLVRQVLTDKGQEFCNGTMETWYTEHGIVHTKVGPKASQLNLVERTHQTLIGMVKTMMHQSGFPKSFWVHALENAVYVKNRVYCKGAGCTPYETVFGSKPDIHHVRSFGSLTYCHVPVSKKRKLNMNCRMGFLLGYREDVVGCHVYFPTEHKKGFVSDVKINELVKYKDRYESSYPTKVKKWLHTLNESLEEGELVAYADDDQDSASQRAEYDIESEQRVCSNVEMVSSKSSLDEADRNVWNDMVSYSEAVNDSEVNERYDEKLTSIDRRTWDDILQNSRLPDYESSSEVQEGETAISDVDQEKEFSVQVAESLSTENEHDSEDDEGYSCGEDDVAYSDIDNAESDEYAEDEVAKSSIAEHDGDENDGVAIARADTNEFDSDEGDLDDILDRHIIEYDIGDSKLDYDCDVEDIESVGHVTDLVSVDDAGYDSGTDAKKWDYLFDPNDEREAYDDQVTERQLTIPSNQLIGHIHPRDEEIRRTRDKKRTQLQAKRLMVAAARRSKLLNSEEQQQPERRQDTKELQAGYAIEAC